MRKLPTIMLVGSLTVTPTTAAALAAGGTAVTLVVSCEDNRAKKTTSKRYDPKLGPRVNICLVTDHLDSNDSNDKDHRTAGRDGRWQTSGNVPAGCKVEVRKKGRNADGSKPGWKTVATGRNSTFYIVSDVYDRFRVRGCGPRNYSPTAGYGVVKIECKSNAERGANGESCKDNGDCT